MKVNWKRIGEWWSQVNMESAGLAFASLFSLIPLVSLLVVCLQFFLPRMSVLESVQGILTNLMDTTFDSATRTKVFQIISTGIDQFYKWKGTWLSALSIALIVVVGLGLLRRIQFSAYRMYEVPVPKLKIQGFHLVRSLMWILLVFGMTGLKPILQHQLNTPMYLAAGFGLTVLQLLGIALFLKSIYPIKARLRTATWATVFGYIGWKVLTKLLKAYALFTVKSRSVLGPWAIVPLFLMWIYAQFALLFVSVGLLHVLNLRRMNTLPNPPRGKRGREPKRTS